jgi:hypothetical protein
MDPNEVSSTLKEASHTSEYKPELRPYQFMPTLRTRSALGILRELTQPDLGWDLVTFIQADNKEGDYPTDVENIRSMIKKFSADCSEGSERDFYIFDSSKLTRRPIEPSNEDPSQYKKPWMKPPPSWNWPINDLPHKPQYATTRFAASRPTQTYNGIQDYYEDRDLPLQADRWRHYILVFYQDANKRPPRDAYVSAECHGKCFYIDGDDVVSQRNFALVCHFLTIQAVPQSAPLTPTIGVGATH